MQHLFKFLIEFEYKCLMKQWLDLKQFYRFALIVWVLIMYERL